MTKTEALQGCTVEFVEEKGVVRAELYDEEGELIYRSDRWLTGSIDPLMEFTRDTKRVIKVWEADGTLHDTLAAGTLAPYWDAAQAANDKLPCSMTILDALKGCAAALGKIKAPVDLLEEVAIPVRAVKNTIRDVIGALEAKQEEKKE